MRSHTLNCLVPFLRPQNSWEFALRALVSQQSFLCPRGKGRFIPSQSQDEVIGFSSIISWNRKKHKHTSLLAGRHSRFCYYFLICVSTFPAAYSVFVNRNRVSLPLAYNTLLVWIKMRSQPGLLSTLAKEASFCHGQQWMQGCLSGQSGESKRLTGQK